MNFLDALDASASGLSAQRLRMNLISSNLANINTTRTPEGEPYRRKDAVFEAVDRQNSFKNVLDASLSSNLTQVKVAEVIEDDRDFQQKFDPGHPDADENGYVLLPNINVVEEMVNMISATRSFEANVSAVKATKDMAASALEIGR